MTLYIHDECSRLVAEGGAVHGLLYYLVDIQIPKTENSHGYLDQTIRSVRSPREQQITEKAKRRGNLQRPRRVADQEATSFDAPDDPCPPSEGRPGESRDGVRPQGAAPAFEGRLASPVRA